MSLSFKMKVSTKPFQEYSANVQNKLKTVVKKHALNLEALTKDEISNQHLVDTGAMMNSIKALPEKDERNWTVSDAVDYGVYQELGTSRGIPAHHFLGGSAEKIADKFFDDIKEALQ